MFQLSFSHSCLESRDLINVMQWGFWTSWTSGKRLEQVLRGYQKRKLITAVVVQNFTVCKYFTLTGTESSGAADSSSMK